MRSFWPPRGGSPSHAMGGCSLGPAALPALLRASHLLGLALGSALGRLGEARRRRHVGRTQQRQSRVPDGDAEDPRGNPEHRSGERLGTTILVEDRHGARYTLTAPGAKYLAPRRPTRATNTVI